MKFTLLYSIYVHVTFFLVLDVISVAMYSCSAATCVFNIAHLIYVASIRVFAHVRYFAMQPYSMNISLLLH